MRCGQEENQTYCIRGSEAFVHVPKQLRDMLDAKAKKLLLFGYKGDCWLFYGSGTKRVSEREEM